MYVYRKEEDGKVWWAEADSYEVRDLSLQPVSLLNLYHLNQLFKLYVIPYPRYNTGITTLPFFPLSSLYSQSARYLAKGSPLCVYLQHSSFDGDVWLTQVIPATKKNHMYFTWTFLCGQNLQQVILNGKHSMTPSHSLSAQPLQPVSVHLLISYVRNNCILFKLFDLIPLWF